MGDPAVYEERFRLTMPVAGALAGDVGFVAVMAVMPAPLALRAVVLGVFGWFAVVTGATVVMRRVAFRADATGITLGGSPFRYMATTRVFPWAEIAEVVVWRRAIPFRVLGRVYSSPLRLRYLGVRRVAGAEPLPGRLANIPALSLVRGAVPPPGVAAGAGRVVSAWRLDTARLASALAALAPQVKLSVVGQSA